MSSISNLYDICECCYKKKIVYKNKIMIGGEMFNGWFCNDCIEESSK